MGTWWLGPTAMVLTAVVALGCVLSSRPRRVGAVIAATVMVLAMVDMALGHVLFAPVVWAGLLVTLGVVVVALPRAGDDHASWQHGLALVAAAVIVIVSPHAAPTVGGAGHAGHLSPVGLLGGWGLGLAVALAYATVALLPLRRTPSASAPGPVAVGRAHLLQVVTTTGCLALMAVAPSMA
ncbi:MAG TPA: hypothetical protein VIT41_00230 [Microlunatus sp.]